MTNYAKSCQSLWQQDVLRVTFEGFNFRQITTIPPSCYCAKTIHCRCSQRRLHAELQAIYFNKQICRSPYSDAYMQDTS
jgi:hypothetical protein